MQTDVGAPLVPGSARFDAATGHYTVTSAGYNIWYFRDEFRYLWKKESGDISLAADVEFPNPHGYGDRKAVLVIRQDLDDDSQEVMTALHGAGLIHLAFRPGKGGNIREAFRIEGSPPQNQTPGKDGTAPLRMGVQKLGDSFALFVSLKGEPLHRAGPSVNLHFDEPFYVGIGFCSHLPATADTAVLSRVLLRNSADEIH